MPLRNGKPLTIRPTTVCDSQDLTNGPPGGMLALTNLIPAPKTNRCWVPRPAAQLKSAFAGMLAPGFGSGELVVGNMLYGTIASGRNPGFDEPFVLNLTTGALVPVSGITASNVPVSPPTTGDWVPPILAQIGQRIIVTHPGFTGTFQATTEGNTVAGSTTVTAAPTLAGTQAGNSISGPGIPGGTTIVETVPFILTASATTNSTDLLISVISAGNLFPGMSILDLTGSIPPGTTITSVNVGAQQVTMSNPAAASAVGVTLLFGGTNIVLSQAATQTLALAPLSVSGHNGAFFGWFDISSFVAITSGGTFPGSNVITGNPTIAGVQPGMSIVGTGLAPGTTVVAVANNVVDTTGDLNSTVDVANLAQTFGIYPGMTVAGEGIPIGTTVSAIIDDSVVLSQTATATASGVALTFSGALIVISQAAVAYGNPDTLTITGGTPTNPQWAAGNTQGNPLIAVPVSVAQMAGSAFYAVQNGVQISDPLLPCQITNESQALTFANGLPVTALGSLPLNSLLGGIVQAIIAFQGTSAMQQITGAFSTSNLAVNQLPIETGTLAPLSIVPTSKGLTFVSPEGLRFINFACQVGDPIGDAGKGVTAPFIFAPTPSRICAAAQANTLRISVPVSQAGVIVPQEYWWDFTREIWSGPHTFPASLIQPWGSTFVMFPAGILGQLWQSDATQNSNTSFIENGAPVGCFYATSLLPDTDAMAENAVVESTITLALPAGALASIGATADDGTLLDSVILNGIGGVPAIWGQMPWGQATWGSAGPPPFLQRQIPWEAPLVFKQAGFSVTVNAAPGLMIGNLYLRYQILGYLLERIA